MFLSILAHHSKNRYVKFQFRRSGQTVSQEFHSVLRSVLKLHSLFLVKPLHVPEDSNDPRWDPLCVGVGQDSGKGKAPKGRRSCTRVEEDALIHCLTDIVNDGWKAENSFKARF
ncbi:hypothetical protein ACS0TY_011683 [Phlomoides rotata]